MGKTFKFGVDILQIVDKDHKNEAKYIWLNDGISREKAEEIAKNFLNEFIFTSPVTPFYPELKLIRYNMDMKLSLNEKGCASTITGMEFNFEFAIEDGTDVVELYKLTNGEYEGKEEYNSIAAAGIFKLFTYQNMFPYINFIGHNKIEIV